MKTLIVSFCLIISIVFVSCEVESTEYTLKGSLSRAEDNPSEYKIQFYKSFNEGSRPKIELLGEALTNSNGEYEFKYSIDSKNTLNRVKLFIYDRNNKRIKDIEDLPFAQNWSKDFNVSIDAYVEFTFYSENPLKELDTLYFESGLGGRLLYTGPKENYFKDTIRIHNIYHVFSWSTKLEEMYAPKAQTISISPKGSPNIDQLKINYINQ
jgi:hypothetical protein